MPDPGRRAHACSCGGRCPACQAARRAKERERLQTRRAHPGDATQVAAPPVVHQVLAEPGRPLDPDARAYFEPRFGRDFGEVRVHTGAKAAESSTVVNALAYTVGRHIVFAPNQYAPATHVGRRLLAHELAHVVQQGGEAIALQRQRQAGGAGALARDLGKMSSDLAQIGEQVGQVAEDLEVLRHQFFLAGKPLPKAGEPIESATVAAFVEALIETSRTIGPYLRRKRAKTSIGEKLTISTSQAEFEKLPGVLDRTRPTIGGAKPTKITTGTYDRATGTIHLSPDAKFGGALHEGIHRYAWPVVHTRLGLFLDEGLTQYFTDLVKTDHLVKGHHNHAYDDELACAKKFIWWFKKREAVVWRAYFRGEVEDVEPVLQEVMRRLKVNDKQLRDIARERKGEALCERIMDSS